jgi:hypothetical protein
MNSHNPVKPIDNKNIIMPNYNNNKGKNTTMPNTYSNNNSKTKPIFLSEKKNSGK